MTMELRRRRPRSLGEVFAIPAAIGLASGAGLIVALVDDGWWDIVGWVGLGIAPAIAALYLVRPRSTA